MHDKYVMLQYLKGKEIMTDENKNCRCRRKSIQRDCLDDALQFYQVAENQNPLIRMYPKIALLTFSCELFLKTMLLCRKNEEKVNEHNLQKLFERLPSEKKEELISKWQNENEGDLLELLSEFGNAFVEWRYAYEREKIDANITHLEKLAAFLKENAETTYGLCLY